MGTSGQSITLANSIIGVGILAMPFCFQQCGVLLATLMLFLMGLVSRLSCYFLLKSAILARRRNYEFLAFHVFGPAGKTAVEIGTIGFLMGTCVAYFVVVGDLGPQIISKMFHINQSDNLRTTVMVSVSLLCVLPLALLRDVGSLGGVSAATLGFYFCLVVKVICEAGGPLAAPGALAALAWWRPAGVLQCAPIFAMALFCQTQLFEIFESLPSLSLEKMNLVTKNAINICSSVYFTLGLFGYIAFHSQTISGNILVNLSETPASDVIKLGFALSLAFSFPLVIFPCRASLYSFLYRKPGAATEAAGGIPAGAWRRLTALVVLGALAAGLLASNVERVLGLLGASAGGLVCLVLPAAAYCRLQPRHALSAKVTLVLGLIIMVLGTYANLEAADGARGGGARGGGVRGGERAAQDDIDKIVEDFFEGRKVDKGDELIPKPLSDGYQPAPPELKIIKQEPEIIKESEIQPPNPVPPEAQPQEKILKPNIKEKLKEIRKEMTAMKLKADQSSAHPKNLKNKLENISLTKIEEEKIKEVEDTDDKAKSEEKKTEEKAEEIIQQQELIETIKQHGEEQKELIKEQKEILDEMIKTKEELKQNKKEVVDIEAKKLAVESIQKIANIAIKSLAGASEKPANIEDKKEKPFDKIANEAVQEIALKAVESIVAINKIEETAKDTKTIDLEKDKPNKAEPVLSVVENDHAFEPSPKVIKQEVHKKISPINDNIQPNIPKLELPKQHSHAVDEPQSYMQGEDKQIIKKFDTNIPIAVALNGNSNQAHERPKNIQDNKPVANSLEKVEPKTEERLRQKREADCTNALEESEICDKDMANHNVLRKEVGNDQELPKVDLNDLLSRLPMNTAVHGRSLKSVEDKKR